MLYGRTHNRFVRVPLDWAACGTSANYRAHLKRGETPCEPCRKANARDTNNRRPSCRQCDRRAQVRGLCAIHFRAAQGVTIPEWRKRVIARRAMTNDGGLR